MVRLTFLYLALSTSLVLGCRVVMPTHQLPQGYSESYRRILQERTRVSEAEPGEFIELEEPILTPPIPISLPEADVVPELTAPVDVDLNDVEGEPGETTDAI